MNITTKVTGVFRDINTGEITKTIEGVNHLQTSQLRYLIELSAYYSTNYSFFDTMFVSSENPGKQSYDWETVPNARAGAVTTGLPDKEITLDVEPGIHLIRDAKRFSPPATDTEINLAGFCDNVSSENALKTRTVVWFSSPCTQTTTETLDLFYQVQIHFNSNWMNEPTSPELTAKEAAQFAEALIGTSTVAYPITGSYLKHRSLKGPARLFGGYDVPNSNAVTTDYRGRSDLFKRTVHFDVAQTIAVGHQISGVTTNDTVHVQHDINELGNIPVLQTAFSHNATAITPFYDAAHVASGVGQITFNADNWVQDSYPVYGLIDIKTSGGAGTGTYKFSTLPSLGFNGNTFQEHSVSLDIFVEGWAESVYGSHITLSKNRKKAFVYPYLDHVNKALIIRSHFFAIWNIAHQSLDIYDAYRIFGAEQNPLFVPTDIRQIHIDADDTIWVADGGTSLYKIASDRSSVTVINSGVTGLSNTSGCYGVTRGYNNRLFAYFNHTTTPTIYYSDDDGNSWTAAGFTEAVIDASPNLVGGIKADPSHADHRLAVTYYTTDADTTGNVYMVWYDLTADTVSAATLLGSKTGYDAGSIGYLDANNYTGNTRLACSPTQGKWYTNYTPAFFLTFNSVGGVSMGNDVDISSLALHFFTDSAGDDWVIYQADRYNNNNTGANLNRGLVAVKDDTTYECFSSAFSMFTSDDGILLPGGFVIGFSNSTGSEDDLDNAFIGQYQLPPKDRSAFSAISKFIYTEYGWDGTQWVKDHAGEKQIHATAEELLPGVTVAFNDQGSNSAYVATDYYSFRLFDGVWMDGYTSFSYDLSFYYKATKIDTDVEVTALPSTQKVRNELITTTPLEHTFTDINSAQVNSTTGTIASVGTDTTQSITASIRSNDPIILGTIQSLSPNSTRFPGVEQTNVQGVCELTLYWDSNTYLDFYAGLSDISVLSTSIDPATIQYGLRFTAPTNSGGIGTVEVIESGQVRASGIPIRFSLTAYDKFRIVLFNDKTIGYFIQKDGTGNWHEIYKTPINSVIMQDYYFDAAWNPRNNYGVTVEFSALDAATSDYYLYLGNGADSGLFSADFIGIDPDETTIQIAGTVATMIGENDTISTLPANTYSIFPLQGVIRYSPDDVGKTIAAEYLTVTHT